MRNTNHFPEFLSLIIWVDSFFHIQLELSFGKLNTNPHKRKSLQKFFSVICQNMKISTNKSEKPFSFFAQKKCLNVLKFCEVSWAAKSNIWWNFRHLMRQCLSYLTDRYHTVNIYSWSIGWLQEKPLLLLSTGTFL